MRVSAWSGVFLAPPSDRTSPIAPAGRSYVLVRIAVPRVPCRGFDASDRQGLRTQPRTLKPPGRSGIREWLARGFPIKVRCPVADSETPDSVRTRGINHGNGYLDQ